MKLVSGGLAKEESATYVLLRSLGIINTHIDVKPAPGLRSAKLSRVTKASRIEFNRAILLIDGDGHPEEARRRQEQHLPEEPELRRRATVITNTYEIEERLLHALYNEEPKGSRPSDRLPNTQNPAKHTQHCSPTLCIDAANPCHST